MYKLFLALRYLRKRRIAYFAVLAVALCVAMVIVVHSVMDGFLDTVRNSSRRLLGDVILEIGGMETFPHYDEFIAVVRESLGDDITAATPVIINVGLLKFLSEFGHDPTHPIQITGIRLDEYRKINSFGESLFYDRHYPNTTTLQEQMAPTWYWDPDSDLAMLPPTYEAARKSYLASAPDADQFRRQPGHPYPGPGLFMIDRDMDGNLVGRDQLPGIIAGIELVAYRQPDGRFRRYIPKGTKAKLTVLSVSRSGNVSDIPAISAAMTLVDDSYTQIYDIDSQTAYCDFEWLQGVLGYDAQELVAGGVTPARATQIQIKLASGVDYVQARQRIENLWHGFLAEVEPELLAEDVIKMQHMMIQTWEQRNASFIGAVEKESILMLILFGLISVVAVFLVGCIFYMIVQEKSREIGIIKSMGATSRGIAGIFLVYATAVGVVGSVFGTVIGVAFVWYINEFQDFIARIHPGLRVWTPQQYSFENIPNDVKPMDVMIIVGVAITASVIGSLIPAIKAARVWPVDAIRYE